MALSVLPWMLAWPRSAFTPPPGMPTLPSSICSNPMPRMICTPEVWWVSPTAYTTLPDLSAAPVAPNSSATARNFSSGMPVICETTSGVYRL
jgi:hypothetical protein